MDGFQSRFFAKWLMILENLSVAAATDSYSVSFLFLGPRTLLPTFWGSSIVRCILFHVVVVFLYLSPPSIPHRHVSLAGCNIASEISRRRASWLKNKRRKCVSYGRLGKVVQRIVCASATLKEKSWHTAMQWRWVNDIAVGSVIILQYHFLLFIVENPSNKTTTYKTVLFCCRSTSQCPHVMSVVTVSPIYCNSSTIAE